MSSPCPQQASQPEVERQRILEALVEVCVARGYRGTSVPLVAERAGVSEETFEQHFADLEDCFAAYILEGREAFFVAVGAAMVDKSEWRKQIRAAAYAMLRFWREDVRRARMMLIEVLAAGPRAQLIRDEGMELMFDLIDQGRSQMEDPEMLSRTTAEAVGGAIFNQMHIALERGELDRGEEMVPQLMYTVVLPYLGTEAALEELELPPPGTG
ncbi:MAG: TetR/AcrR family transcriptional regulator [Solirubrobacterales bacterium]